MTSAYLLSGPLRGATFFCRVGSCDALRMVGFALSSAAGAMAVDKGGMGYNAGKGSSQNRDSA